MTQPMNNPRWQAIVQRDTTQDGLFYYGVSTTGIYCKPSCPSRTAKFEHIRFFDHYQEAEDAGFQACKRCRPNQNSLTQQQVELMTQICEWIQACNIEPSLAEMAEQAGMSIYHFHRVFKQIIHITPKGYARAHTANAIRKQLKAAPTITDAIYRTGYPSNTSFYSESSSQLGMTPSQYRKGGINTQIYFALAECSLGALLVAASERGICSIALGDHADELLNEFQDQYPNATLKGNDAQFELYVAQIISAIDTPQTIGLPLDIRGTAFQRRVWEALREIPIGKTISYSELAAKLNMPKASRAVANACAANQLAVLIPCHRVVRQNGSLSGYRWGIERKRQLLLKESKK